MEGGCPSLWCGVVWCGVVDGRWMSQFVPFVVWCGVVDGRWMSQFVPVCDQFVVFDVFDDFLYI